jgi:phosphoglycolate phosphatase-like HAD superfamily hydrolase
VTVLALDFDGVIFDSSREVFLNGLRTWIALVPESELVASHPLREPDAVPSRHDFAGDPLYRAFAHLTPLGNRAEDFGVAFKIIERQLEVEDQQAYDEVRDACEPSWLEAFHQRFYAERSLLRERSLDDWITLQQPYRPFVDLLGRRAADATLAIVTAKDGTSVRLLLDAHDLGHLFPRELVLDKDTGVHKTAHLDALSELLGREYSEITFVDDKVNHLERVAGLGVRPVLACWGHNTAREHELAHRLGFAAATLETAEAVLFPDP